MKIKNEIYQVDEKKKNVIICLILFQSKKIVIHIYIYISIQKFLIHIDFSIMFFLTNVIWIVFSSLLAECIKLSITSSCINIYFVLINASSTFTNIVLYLTKDIKN